MGFFGNIKKNFNHGVKVRLEAPASVSSQDAELPVTINVTASDNQQTIKRVSVEIIAESRDQSFNVSSSTSTPQVERKVVARAEHNEAFAILANETKTVQLSIIMNQGASIKEQLPEGSGASQIAGALEKLQNISNFTNQKKYTYSLHAVADVEGVAIDPGDTQPLQILAPGEVGGGFNARF